MRERLDSEEYSGGTVIGISAGLYHARWVVDWNSELLESNAFVERMTASGELQRIIDRHMPRTASEPVLSLRADR